MRQAGDAGQRGGRYYCRTGATRCFGRTGRKVSGVATGDILIHATAVALPAPPGMVPAWRGVLLRGPSGAGKSDLALRLMDAGGRLVADDQVCLASESAALFATAPTALAGRIEVRGLGIVAVPALARARLVLAVDLTERASVERLPEPATVTLGGITLPLVRLAAFEDSAVAKVRLAVALAAGDSPPAPAGSVT